ncbi:hypothetical protein DESUT3_02830 [Desulfuromonas versatilis]|uniref:Serine aminopeptidase S33 domain-containing protein n=1 Tax=Desulfuromonas versatilis TaxID=2802975 RepID=A0ABN6DVD3_9BACT|nr:alpha/beta fold hydrolase [Desulfuromonas versatilis]BCR03214.1 hypothetical protein DESUT3_02830 [Desulfuromonas versatilis]
MPRLLPLLGLVSVLSWGCAIPESLLFATDRELRFNPAIARLGFEEILFPAEDGTLLYGWYLPGQAGQPLVLFFQGTATNLSHQYPNLAALQQRGLHVFIFDYRGAGHSRGTASELGIYRDARGALEYLEGRGWQPARMIYFGRSLGAAVALELAVERPPAGVILESPFTSLVELIRHHHPRVVQLMPWLFAEHFPSRDRIARLRSPLLIIQGDQDQVVPQAMARSLFDRAPLPKTLAIVPGAGHGDPFLVGGEGYWATWQSFLHQCLPPQAPGMLGQFPPDPGR